MMNMEVLREEIVAERPLVDADKKNIERVVSVFFSVFSTKEGSRPLLRQLNEIFLPEAIIIKNTGVYPEVFTLNAFIDRTARAITDGLLTEFSESEVAGTTSVYGNIANHFCAFKKVGNRHGTRFHLFGMKSLQLVRVNEDWKISSVIWDEEKPLTF